jgi:hypothetical protein
VAPVIEHEVEKGIELREGEVRLNCVFSQMGLAYKAHKACPKRKKRTPTESLLNRRRRRKLRRPAQRERTRGDPLKPLP